MVGLHARNIPTSFNQFSQVVEEEKLFKEIVDARTMDDGQYAITKA